MVDGQLNDRSQLLARVGRRLAWAYGWMVTSPLPRALTSKEAALLTHLLRHDRPGFDVLRTQVALARVQRPWFEGSLSFDIVIRDGIVRADLADGPYADREWSWTSDGQPIGFFMVWVEHGQLSALEYAWVSDEMPTTYPGLSEIREPRPDESS